ncbi:ATP-binding protein [Roseomonas sp. NAR14]|uniref:histidine kinase n=1 Tax=Roseomonas acroporae TaxID=2937791 RepID=A0A9X1YD50_9PROT|nr:ATP-binding protein [Roseomonas acroporae]MCK8787597.1 ATP-binding protein [Roseomonas acroporae]
MTEPGGAGRRAATREETDAWPAGGGEVGALLRRPGFSAAGLGPPDRWPPSLRGVVELVAASRQAMFVAWGAELAFLYNDAYVPIFAERHPAALGLPFREVWSDIWPQFAPLVDRTMRGEASLHREMLIPMMREGRFRDTWFTFSYTPLRDEAGRIAGILCATMEVTDQVLGKQRERAALAALHERTAALETVNRAGIAITGETDLGRVAQTVTDAGVALTGAEFGAFFYEAHGARGAEGAGAGAGGVEGSGTEGSGVEGSGTEGLGPAGSGYRIFALSGVDRAAFAGFPMPRNTALFAPTLSGQSVVRSDDITRDPRYGKNAPHAGMPPGHLPVRSYLAVPVRSRTGEPIGALLFGHSRPGRFSETDEASLVSVAGQAAVAIDNARLLEAADREIRRRRRVEEQLRQLNETLEARVAAEIAERRQAAAALQQAQKMESIGRLTGGIAHDFNNLLQVVAGNLHLLARDVAGNARAERRVANALAGAMRGARLASQLLAFGRRQPLEPKVVNIASLVAGMDDLLRRALGEAIVVDLRIDGALWNTLVDPVQLETALLNLAINARDAMDGAGRLTIVAGNAALDARHAAADAEAAPGDYVVLSVGDTGCGMPPEVLAQAFEPFFSTKPEGKGTGLGLSMVYGFVRQSGGHVRIRSEVGVGTVVRLFLPRAAGAGEAAAAGAEAGPLSAAAGAGSLVGGTETILVVEDDEQVRTTVVEMLGDLGYRVLAAPDATVALAMLEGDAVVDLLFTDVIMPGPLRSTELARLARERRPGLAVLFTSGYTENTLMQGNRLGADIELLSKPYASEALARRIRHLLAGRATRHAATGAAGEAVPDGAPDRAAPSATLEEAAASGVVGGAAPSGVVESTAPSGVVENATPSGVRDAPRGSAADPRRGGAGPNPERRCS